MLRKVYGWCRRRSIRCDISQCWLPVCVLYPRMACPYQMIKLYVLYVMNTFGLWLERDCAAERLAVCIVFLSCHTHMYGSPSLPRTWPSCTRRASSPHLCDLKQYQSEFHEELDLKQSRQSFMSINLYAILLLFLLVWQGIYEKRDGASSYMRVLLHVRGASSP